jgi:hypothetical protein
MLANGRGNLVGVEVVGSAYLLPKLVEILDDGVSALHDDGLAGSSSGVQMIGGASPSERQTASIVPRIAAFARCLQFHVSRYVTSWAAAIPMWKASTVAFFGRAPWCTSAFASRVAASESGNAAEHPESTRLPDSIASRGLVEHELGDPQRVRRASLPPIARQPLVSRKHDVSAWPSCQVADNARFDVDRRHGRMISYRRFVHRLGLPTSRRGKPGSQNRNAV